MVQPILNGLDGSIDLPTPAARRLFRVGYALLALNFILPAASYVIAPEMAVETMDQLNRLLGGGPYPLAESGRLWHMLAVTNVSTLGFMCVLLWSDLERFAPVLPALLFSKGSSALAALVIWGVEGLPAFAAVFLLDAVTTAVMWLLATLALAEARARPRTALP